MSDVIDPRRESIFAGVREDPTVPASDPGRFRVTVRPHRFEARVSRFEVEQAICSWCGAARLGRLHPLERPA